MLDLRHILPLLLYDKLPSLIQSPAESSDLISIGLRLLPLLEHLCLWLITRTPKGILNCLRRVLWTLLIHLLLHTTNPMGAI